MEIYIVLSKLLFNFDWSLCHEREGWMNQRTYTIWDKPPLMVNLTNSSYEKGCEGIMISFS